MSKKEEKSEAETYCAHCDQRVGIDDGEFDEDGFCCHRCLGEMVEEG